MFGIFSSSNPLEPSLSFASHAELEAEQKRSNQDHHSKRKRVDLTDDCDPPPKKLKLKADKTRTGRKPQNNQTSGISPGILGRFTGLLPWTPWRKSGDQVRSYRFPCENEIPNEFDSQNPTTSFNFVWPPVPSASVDHAMQDEGDADPSSSHPSAIPELVPSAPAITPEREKQDDCPVMDAQSGIHSAPEDASLNLVALTPTALQQPSSSASFFPLSTDMPSARSPSTDSAKTIKPSNVDVVSAALCKHLGLANFASKVKPDFHAWQKELPESNEWTTVSH